jgi:hypothetical protein
MRCSSCNFDNVAVRKFCIQCGAALRPRCLKCGSENPPEAGFCGECGTALSKHAAIEGSAKHAAASTVVEGRGPSEGPEGERKTVTALFADIKGSTELMRLCVNGSSASAASRLTLTLPVTVARLALRSGHCDANIVQLALSPDQSEQSLRGQRAAQRLRLPRRAGP